MPIIRPAQLLATACLVVATLFGVAPRPADALEPPRPLPGHRPAFVTETDTRPWVDCLWASAAMLADKWTNGDIQVTHGELRRLSGDSSGGSSFEELQVAFHRLGLHIPLNTHGDSTLTWGGLLDRLRNGAGAVVLGDDGQLPRWYGRWDTRFWRKEGKEDNHAVYVERYSHGRVWIMDPLARGAWKGEWISVAALHRFAWFKGRYVAAVTSPTARAAPFKGVRLDREQIAISPAAVTVTWRIRAARRWHYPGADLHVSIRPAADPIAAAISTAQIAPRATVDVAPRRSTIAVSRRALRLSAPVPTRPGAYTVAFSLTERRFGLRVVASHPVALFVPGPRRASMRLNVNERFLNAGGGVKIHLTVANTGTSSWADPVRPGGDATLRARTTRVVATWVLLDTPAELAAAAARAGTTIARTSAKPAAKDAAKPVPLVVELRRVPMAPGRMVRIRQGLAVPEQVGHWALVVDIVDDVAGSFAALGSTPSVALFEVVPPRGIEVVD